MEREKRSEIALVFAVIMAILAIGSGRGFPGITVTYMVAYGYMNDILKENLEKEDE